MWEEATYLCVHTCRGKLFTKPIPSYNLESLVAAWICSDPCCHQKRGKKKAKTQQPICSSTVKNANKHLQSQPKGKTQLETHPVYREHVPHSGIQGRVSAPRTKCSPRPVELKQCYSAKEQTSNLRRQLPWRFQSRVLQFKWPSYFS